ncbi:unnamed protein product [Arabis nemorensis]|uniref:MATH domain-containing protein n=1 Tax=Arabis nemorensis TaxID=586526 RepID=A0A565BXJ5_9BRAS|nr:unnamed protein product [Arabis nemorensis]
MIPLSKLHDKSGGLFVNEEVKIVAEVDVLDVIGKLDVPEEAEEATQPLKKTKLNNDGDVSSHKETSSVKESIDVNGFQVLPSQAESVKHIFEKHPNMALNFPAKNQDLRTSCMNVLLNLIKTLCQSLRDLSIDDLGQADNALTYLKNSGFKVDWLERKLEEKCSDKEARLEKEKEELKDLKQKCSDIEVLLEKKKEKVLAARAPSLTLDDVV